MQIFHGQTLVAVHSRLRRPGGKPTVNEHLPPEARAYLMQTPQWCLEHAEGIGSMGRELVDQLFASRVLDNLRAAQGVLGLKKKYGPIMGECRGSSRFAPGPATLHWYTARSASGSISRFVHSRKKWL